MLKEPRLLFAAQIAICIALSGYLWQRQAYLRWINQQTWEFLTAELQRYPSESGNPSVRLQHARVAMAMADYAERNGDPNSAMPGRTEVANLRRNAMEMRVASLRAILGFAQPQQAS